MVTEPRSQAAVRFIFSARMWAMVTKPPRKSVMGQRVTEDCELQLAHAEQLT